MQGEAHQPRHVPQLRSPDLLRRQLRGAPPELLPELELLERGDHGSREGRVALELAQERARDHFGLRVVRHELGQEGADLGLDGRREELEHFEELVQEGGAAVHGAVEPAELRQDGAAAGELLRRVAHQSGPLQERGGRAPAGPGARQ